MCCLLLDMSGILTGCENPTIGLFKVFSCWIFGILNIQIQREGGTNSCELFVLLKLDLL